MAPFRVVVVDDSALFRAMLRNLLTDIPNCEIVASVADGTTAIEKITELRPDLVTLDVEMPSISGIGVLRAAHLLHVLAITTVPGRLVDLDVTLFQDFIDGFHVFNGNDFAKADGLHVIGRDHDGHLIVDDLKHVKLLLLAAHFPLFNALHDGDAVSGVNSAVSNLEHR